MDPGLLRAINHGRTVVGACCDTVGWQYYTLYDVEVDASQPLSLKQAQLFTVRSASCRSSNNAVRGIGRVGTMSASAVMYDTSMIASDLTAATAGRNSIDSIRV